MCLSMNTSCPIYTWTINDQLLLWALLRSLPFIGCVGGGGENSKPLGRSVRKCRNALYIGDILLFYDFSGPPSPPINLTVNNVEPASFEVSWNPGPTDSTRNLSHYIVQLDKASPVWVQNPHVTLSYSSSPDSRHVIGVRAVDMCGQQSNMTSCEVDRGRQMNSNSSADGGRQGDSANPTDRPTQVHQMHAGAAAIGRG